MNLRSAIAVSTSAARRWLAGRDRSIDLAAFDTARFVDGAPELVAGRNVMLACDDQLAAAVALIDLDGLAHSVLLCPPDVRPDHVAELAATAEIELIVGSPARPGALAHLQRPMVVVDPAQAQPADRHGDAAATTAWLLLTSGTSGIPKIVEHSFAGLTAAMTVGASATAPVWSTFYDIRRYGGLQIFLRAMTGGGSMVLSDAGEPVGDFLQRAARLGVTHMSGTPSHWRHAIMSPHAAAIRPAYVRMSGEIADQAIIDMLQAQYPQAGVAHAYASTEAGVAFPVDDGREGFPAALVDAATGPVQMKVVDGTLRIRSPGTATRYVGPAVAPLLDAEGFVDTGDVVERRGERFYFVGRRGGIINIGGLKVHPEEVEAVLNRHAAVRMSYVKARKNVITGAIVTAEVVLAADVSGRDEVALKADILQHCHAALPPHKVPAILTFVPSLAVAQSGKMVRTHV